MTLTHPITITILGVILLIAGAWLAHHFFSADARWERRRRRSNRRVSSKTNRPMVKFSVRAKGKRNQ